MALFAENFLKGYEMGRNRKRQDEQDKLAAEDRKLEMAKQKLLMDHMKIQDKEEARKSARGEVDWMRTQPGQEQAGPTEDGQPLVEQRHAPMTIPEGGYGQPAMTVTPPTQQADLKTILANKIQTERASRMRTVDLGAARLLGVDPGEYDSDVLKEGVSRSTAMYGQDQANRREAMGNSAALTREKMGNDTALQVAGINAAAKGTTAGSEESQHWAELLNSGEATLSQVPTKQRAAAVNHLFGSNLAIMTPKVQEKMDQFITAQASMTHIKETLAKMVSAEGMDKASAALQLNTEVNALSRNIGRSMGEKGVFTDADKADFASLIGFGASAPGGVAAMSMLMPGEAEKRIDSAMALMDQVRERTMSSISSRSGGRQLGGAGAHKVGELKTFPNGNIGKWDGDSWEQVH